MPTVWRLVAHHSDAEFHEVAVRRSAKRKRLAIGWGGTGDLRKRRVKSEADLAALIRAKRPHMINEVLGARSLWRLLHQVRNKDLVIVTTGTKGPQGRRLRLVMKIDGRYKYDSAKDRKLNRCLCHPRHGGEYYHHRPATLVTDDPEEVRRLWRHLGGQRGMSRDCYYLTLRRFVKSAPTDLESILRPRRRRVGKRR